MIRDVAVTGYGHDPADLNTANASAKADTERRVMPGAFEKIMADGGCPSKCPYLSFGAKNLRWGTPMERPGLPLYSVVITLTFDVVVECSDLIP
jgi:hypothetical protein